MANSPENTDLDRLKERIQGAKGEQMPEAASPEPTPVPISRIGFDFLATVMGSAILGWLVDRSLGSKPWGMIAILALGFLAGIVGVWRAMMAGDAPSADKGK